MPIVERLLVEQAPDVLCLQETKVPDELFPEKAFRKAGYEHIAFHGLIRSSGYQIRFDGVSIATIFAD